MDRAAIGGGRRVGGHWLKTYIYGKEEEGKGKEEVEVGTRKGGRDGRCCWGRVLYNKINHFFARNPNYSKCGDKDTAVNQRNISESASLSPPERLLSRRCCRPRQCTLRWGRGGVKMPPSRGVTKCFIFA